MYVTCKITLHVAQIVNKEHLQPYCRNTVCRRNVLITTLQKGDNKNSSNKVLLVSL